MAGALALGSRWCARSRVGNRLVTCMSPAPPRPGPRFVGLATLHPQICPHGHKRRGAAAVPGDPFCLSCKLSYKPPPPGEAAQRMGPYDSCLVPPRGRGTRDIFRHTQVWARAGALL